MLKGVKIMKYTYKIVVFILCIAHSLLESAPSVRSRSRIQSEEEPKTSSPRQKPTAVQTPSAPQRLAEQSTAPTKTDDDESPDQPTASTPEPVDIITLFERKLLVSSLLTTEITNYFFNAAFQVIKTEKNKATLDKKLRTFFDGLRYPFHRHLRESVSSYADRNSFLNGFVENTLVAANTPSSDKEIFIKNINNIGQALKKFKIYHIDKALPSELETHMGNVDSQCTTLERSFPSGTQLGGMAKGITQIIDKTYKKNIAELYHYINDRQIQPLLPAHEGSLKYVYRSGRKATLATTSYLYKNIKNYAQRMFISTVYSALLHPVNTVNKLLGRPTGEIPEEKSAPKLSNISELLKQAKESVSSRAGSVHNYLTQGGIKNIGSDILSAAQTGTMNIIQGAWPYFTRNYILPFVRKNTIVQIDTYFYDLPESLNKEFMAANRQALEKIALLDREFMETSAYFVAYYIEELVQSLSSKIASKTLAQDQNSAMEIITKSLQSAQIELFRHRRTVLSELSNPKAFTGNYFSYLHSVYVLQHNNKDTQADPNTPQEKIISYVKRTPFMGMKEEGVIDEYYEVVKANDPLLQQLSVRLSTDPANQADLIRLKGPFTKTEIRNLIETFEALAETICKEIKSFGARSQSKLIQNYWLSVIDKDYSNKLMAHLAAVEEEIKVLIGCTIQPVPLYSNEGIPMKYADGVPIVVNHPLASPYAAQAMYQIVKYCYLDPLSKIATDLKSEPLHSQLPQGKSWWVKYPVLTAKVGIRSTKVVVKQIVDESLVPIAIGIIKGDWKMVMDELMSHLTYSALAANVIGFDYKEVWNHFRNPANWSIEGLFKTKELINSFERVPQHISHAVVKPLGRMMRE